uniref:Ig-like domain-containing protein n=1 Tax=Nothobranchius furzeri TaxID=105023 RepID=A0A8C6L964_NOTFU
MGTEVMWLSLVLSAVLTAGQETSQDIPEGASTLAFVFDVTGSMYDDLVQVIEGASKILETSLSRPKRPLYNFALVPFHDPEIGPVTITTDPKKFQQELRELYVQGGGDCPEMSIGAIKIALEISLPGSFIYVFTDARSKDFKLTHKVLQLIQQKQSQVVFVLTGDCDDRNHVGYKVYEEIASTSSGQVFHLDKRQVNEVLKWVEEAVQSSKVNLLSTDHFSQASNNWQMPFDPSLKEVTVALSGPAPGIEIRKLVGENDGLTELLHIPNSAKVVNIKDPEPGMWSIKISSKGRHSVRISGLSTIDFRAGFSRKPTMDFKMTSSRPVQGIPTHILLNTTGLSPPARPDRLELLKVTGQVIKTLPVRYYPERQPYSLWNLTEFLPPNEAFFLRVTGYDQDGYIFQRVSSVSFSSIVPNAPKVVMPPTTSGYYLQRGALRCQVESLIPFTLRFSRDGRRLGVDLLFSESDSASWEIEQVTLKDEGDYECIAISSAGTGRAQTFLDPPPAITVEGNVTVPPASRAVLTCHVVSTVTFNLTWLRGGLDVRLDPRANILTNHSLRVSGVTPDHAGWYECIATNEGGSTSERIYLTVQEVPRVHVEPQNQTFVVGDDVIIRCSASGFPPPRLIWTHNDIHRMTPDGSLVMRNMKKKDRGMYSCLASNQAGTDSMTSILTYFEFPVVTVALGKILTAIGETTVMTCSATGIPQPEIRWYKGDTQFHSSSHLEVDMKGGTLTIKQTQIDDAGDYTCDAVNAAGSSSGRVSLDVGAGPTFTREPSDVAADIGSNVTLSCHAEGYPEPQITWRREDGSPLLNRLRTHGSISQRRGDLHIINLWVMDEAVFICEAQNLFGKIQTQASIIVTGLVKPVIALSPAVLSVIEDQQLTLPCVLLAGNPLPERQWLHNYGLVTPDQYVTVRRDGSLHIDRVQLDDGGDYTCLAENVIGATNQTTTVNVYVPPRIQPGPRVMKVKVGHQVDLACVVTGVPEPTLTWTKGGKRYPLTGNEPGLSILEDGTLLILASVSPLDDGEYVCYAANDGGLQRAQYLERGKYLKIPRAQASDAGRFTCKVTNVAGSAEKTYEVDIYLPPTIPGADDGPSEKRVVLTKHLILECEAAGHPPPSLTWLKDGVPVRDGESVRVLERGRKIEILSATVSDSGRYVCVAMSVAGEKEVKYDVKVLVPPSIRITGHSERSVVLHKSISLECISSGIPPPNITWLKDGRPVDTTMEHLKVARLEDSGKYTCLATNAAGEAQQNVQLSIHEPPSISSSGQIINQTILSGFSTELECKATGSPLPGEKASSSMFYCHYSQPGVRVFIRYLRLISLLGCAAPAVTWHKDGRPLTIAAGVSVLKRGQVLEIEQAQLSDAGMYRCVAVNLAGAAEVLYSLQVFGGFELL